MRGGTACLVLLSFLLTIVPLLGLFWNKMKVKKNLLSDFCRKQLSLKTKWQLSCKYFLFSIYSVLLVTLTSSELLNVYKDFLEFGKVKRHQQARLSSSNPLLIWRFTEPRASPMLYPQLYPASHFFNLYFQASMVRNCIYKKVIIQVDGWLDDSVGVERRLLPRLASQVQSLGPTL